MLETKPSLSLSRNKMLTKLLDRDAGLGKSSTLMDPEDRQMHYRHSKMVSSVKMMIDSMLFYTVFGERLVELDFEERIGKRMRYCRM